MVAYEDMNYKENYTRQEVLELVMGIIGADAAPAADPTKRNAKYSDEVLRYSMNSYKDRMRQSILDITGLEWNEE